MPWALAIFFAAFTYSAILALGTTTSHSSCATESAFMPSRIPPRTLHTAPARSGVPAIAQSRAPLASAASAAASTALSSSCLLEASYITISTASPSFTGNILFRFRSTISISSLSRNSIAVGTNGSSSTFGTMSAHSSRLLNGITSVQVQVGAGSSFNVTSVRIQRVPSEPMIRSFTSYPVVFFTTLDEKFMIDPSGITASIQRTKSLVSP